MKPRSAPFLLFLSFLFMGLLAHSQQKTISGTVKNAQGTPISGASVLVKGTQSGTSTNDKGEFSIVAVEGNTLIISSIGFTATNIVVKGNTGYNIQLQDGSNPMNEVVVTALGIKKQKRELGYSVTEVKGSELAKTNEVNPINALQGKVAGVQIDQGSGGLFGNSKIVIRGNSVIGINGQNNQPIFVVDGVIMENGVFNGTGRDFGNDLKNLNTEDFETVSVLKGSSAAALYGSRAINGVVLITTKKGTKRKGIGVSLTQSVNITDPYAGPTFQNEFGGGSVGAFFTDNRDPNYLPTQSWETKVFPVDPITGKPYIDKQINRELENWGPRFAGQDVINYDGTPTKYVAVPNNFLNSFQTGVGSNTNIAIDGGTDKSTFRLSYNHNDAKGIVPRNTLKKDAFDFRVTHDLTKFLHIDAGVSYSDFYGVNPPRNGGLDAFASDNYGKLFTWAVPRNYDTKYWNRPEEYISKLGGSPDPTNPTGKETVFAPEIRFWFQKAENTYSQREQQLRGRLSLTADLTSWAKFIVEGNFMNINIKNESKELGQSADFVGGSYSLGFDTKYSKFYKAMLMMNKDINKDLSISGYVGAEAQRQTYTNLTSSTDGGLLYPGNYFLANSVKPVITSDGNGGGAGVYYNKSFNSLYASADIAYKNQLFLQATWRGDWSSALTYKNGSGNNFYQYPAISLSWIFTEAMKSRPSWFNYGKLRGNFAYLGNDLGVFLLNPGFALNGFSNANGNTVPVSTYSSGNTIQPNIQPQRKNAKELGLEMRFFKDGRLGLDVSVYQDNTKNQIINVPTPGVSGVSGIVLNAGNLQNRGIEIALDYTAVKTKNFRWNTALNFSSNQNKLVKLYPGITELNLGANIGEISTWAIEGKSYGVMRTTIHSTTDAKTGLPILAWRSDARAAFPARSNVMQDVGNINAKFRAGWDNTFNYKNFSLNILVDAKIGGDFALLTYRYGTHSGVFPNSIAGRDAQSGGIAWTSKYDNINYTDGRIVQGVFAAGQKITQPDGSQVDVGGMTFEDAYKKGYVEPTHTPQFFYRYGSASTGVSDFWVLKNSWVSLRQVALTYNFAKSITDKLRLNGLSLSLIGRDLLYIYQTLPYNYNPASNNSNNTAFSGEEGFLPKTRNINFTLRASF